MAVPRFIQALPFTAAGFDLGLRDAAALYPGMLNVTLEYISPKELAICPDFDLSYHVVAEYYYRRCTDGNTVCALFYPGCNPTITLASLGREWNLFTLNSGTTFSHLRDRALYPSTIDFAPFQYTPYGASVLGFLHKHNWTSVAMVYDNSTRQIFNVMVYNAIEKHLRINGKSIRFYSYPINNSDSVDFDLVVTRVAQVARVVLISTLPDTARNLSMALYRLGAPATEFVRIYMDGPSNPFGPLKYAVGDADDEVAMKSFSGMFVLTACYDYRPEMSLLLSEMKDRAISKYSATFRGGSGPSHFVVAAYASVLLYHQALAEMIAKNLDIRDGTAAANILINRTLSFPSVGRVFLNEYGERQDMMCLTNFQPSTGTFETVMRYDSPTSHLVLAANYSIKWGTWNNQPPRNMPVCGYGNDMCQESIIVPVLLGTFSAVMLSALATILYIRKARINDQDAEWWNIDLNKMMRPRLRSTLVSNLNLSGTRRISRISRVTSVQQDIMTYNGHSVRLQIIKITHKPVFRKSTQDMLNEVRRLANFSQNINRLVGIAIQPTMVTFVKTCCQRGGLDVLLEEFTVDNNLKISLIWDIVQEFTIS
ncbi:atrial natriuretic peptide receptor 1-like [Paramacrobiotus metropolitanus]|uniref:atrial natriuretic peptide receptor 1-like n=1 Tax=Paramacrobiotus metropolitanus TaxID=2943436 RepID=UPI002445B4CD|nr:atrial natriuretic peptide receptor 1-like [Paramacrobiotus metropolitanus]